MHTWNNPNEWSYHPKILIEGCDYTENSYVDMIPISTYLKTYKTPYEAILAAIDAALDYLIANKK